jgi:cell division protein FtsI/penicillin-binding protein 2
VERWQPRSACVVVIDPRNGDVLAMASRPTFDPNDPQPASSRAWTNTAVASMYEPGSTFKPFVAGWAVEQGVVDRQERIDCENGAYRMGRRLLRDEHAHGLLSLSDVLVHSSNIGMAKLGERLTNAGLYQATLAFGFGRRTGIRLPGELTGFVRPLREWNHYSTGSIPIGQELAATPIQIITAYAALANGGRLLSPRLLLRETEAIPLRMEPEPTSEPAPTVVGQAIRPDVARWLIAQPLSDVVRRGTGRRAQLDGYTVFGKTGTAQKVDPATGRYAANKHVCTFVCGAPTENPRALVLVLVDEPTADGEHFGGTVAAPTAAHILEQTLTYLRVSPGRAVRHAARN